MVAETGDFLGTEINSHRMLWSMAGNLAIVHRVFFGMEFQLEGLYFNPVIPAVYGGKKSLSNFDAVGSGPIIRDKGALCWCSINAYRFDRIPMSRNGNF